MTVPNSIRPKTAIIAFLILQAAASATDWSQYRGPTTDGISLDPILTVWPGDGPAVIWRNSSLSNGFSCIVISQGRGFALKSKDDGGGSYGEYCVAVDASTGTNIWSTRVDAAPWDPNVNYNGGDGSSPYNTGDGPRSTPSVSGGRVFVLSGLLHLVCLNVTNGAIIWNRDLPNTEGGSVIQYENCQSPCLDNDLLFLNLNTATDSKTLAAFRTSDGSKAWSSRNENVTHTTPVVTTLQGVRQVIFATTTGLVSLHRDTGALLWKYTYPFSAISVSMGAGPVIYSNIVYCTAGYNKGAAAARVTLSNGVWTVSQLYYKNAASGQAYRSIWMTPVCYQGYIYTLCGENSTFLSTPLSCIELSTGNLMWSTNNFGMGGVILVNSNLLVLTESGDVVLARCNPNAYTELSRFTAFTFDGSLPGKCWNNPTYCDGRIYARSTREGVALDVAAAPSQLPVIAIQPRSRAAVAGSSPSFSVLVTNVSANYQWLFNATNLLAGRTSATLILTNVQASSFGNYSVQASNSSGAVTSAVASLTHAGSPLISSSSLSLRILTLRFTTEYGPTYFVDYKDSLSSPGWIPLTNVAGTGFPAIITDVATANSRFYRIRLQ